MRSTTDAGIAAHRERFMTGVSRLLGETSSGLDGAGAVLTTEIDNLVRAGGKRLRPQLVHLGYRAAGGDGEEHLPAAAALELLHTFALLQDDVMDGSVLRRGQPTAACNLTHLAPAAPTGAISGGQSLAILASDLALIRAEQAFRRLEVRPERLSLAQHYWDLLRYELAAGQALDIMLTGRPPWNEADVLRVADYKSGRYSVLRPLQIGSALGGWSGVLLEQWSLVGLPIGIAFQIQDDLLALTGSPLETGKHGAIDIRSGKATLPMALAFQAAAPGQKRLLRAMVGNATATDEDVSQVLAVLAETGALTRAQAMVEQMLAFGLERLRKLPVTTESRLDLEEIVGRMARRQH